MPPTPEQKAAVRALMAQGMDVQSAIAQVKAGGAVRQAPSAVEQPQPVVSPVRASPRVPAAGRGTGAQVIDVPEMATDVGRAVAEEAPEVYRDMQADALTTAVVGPMGAMLGQAAMPMARRFVRQNITKNQPKQSPGELIAQGGMEGVAETGVGLATVGVPALRRVPGKLLPRFSADRIAKNLGLALTGVVERGGSVETQKKLAGQIIERAKVMGLDLDSPGAGIPIDDVMKTATNFVRDIETPVTKRAQKDIEQWANRKGGARLSINELQNEMARWGKFARSAADGSQEQRQAMEMLDSFRSALDQAIDDPTLKTAVDVYVSTPGTQGVTHMQKVPGATAAATLKEGRQAWRGAATSEDLQDILIRSESVRPDRSLDLGKLAAASSGVKWRDTQKLLAHDPERLAAWTKFTTIAKVLNENTKRNPIVAKLMAPIEPLITDYKINKILGSPEAIEAFRNIATTPRSATPEVVAASVAKLGTVLSKIGEDEETVGPQSALTKEELRALGGKAGSVDKASQAKRNKRRFQEMRKARRTIDRTFESLERTDV